MGTEGGECECMEEDESEGLVDGYYQKDKVEICWSFSHRLNGGNWVVGKDNERKGGMIFD